MRHTTTVAAVSAVAVAALAATARADFDIAPSVSGNKIVTNAYTDEGAGPDNNYRPFVNNVRVFDYAFDDADNPNFTQDPGFHPQPGSGFTAASSIRVGVLAALGYYSGTGPISFGAAPTGTTLTFSYGSQSINVGTTAPASTITLGATNAAGEFDDHLNALLARSGSAAVSNGIYLAQLQVSDPGLSRTPSDAAYVIYGLNVDDAVVDQAKVYLRDTFAPGTNLAPAAAVPEPTSIALIGVTGVAMLGRRRRRA